jgi:rhodanese-related sulfurtransferase
MWDNGRAMPADIGREEVQRLLREGAQLVEVLPRAEYEEEHLPGAIHLPLKKLDAKSAAKLLQRDRPTIVYCFDVQ